MRIGVAIVIAIGAAGCNQLLGLEPTELGDGDDSVIDASIDAMPCVPALTTDEDGDGVLDDCDLCPHLDDPDQTDEDGDGVGNICDPVSGRDDAILFFDSFANGEEAAWTAVRGTWSSGNAMYAQIDEGTVSGLAYRTFDLPPDTLIEAGFEIISAPDLGLPRGVGLLSYSFDFPQGEPDGYECRLGAATGGLTTTELYVWTESVPALLDTGPFAGSIDPEKRIRIRASHTATGELDCINAQDSVSGRASAENTAYAAGVVAVRTIRTAATIEYVIVIGPEPAD